MIKKIIMLLVIASIFMFSCDIAIKKDIQNKFEIDYLGNIELTYHFNLK